LETGVRVVEAGSVAEKRVSTLGGSVVWITSVGRRIEGERGGREREARGGEKAD